MLKFWPSKHDKGMLGIETSSDGVAIAHIVMESNRPRLVSCDYVGADAITSVAETLSERIAALGLKSIPCNWVLPDSDYSLLMVEAPNVPDEELREAMRWRVKDLITFPVEQASLGVFPLPADGVRGGTKMTYVAIADQQQIQSRSEWAKTAKVTLKSIDIAELALRNIAELVAEDQRSLAIVRLKQGSGDLALVKEGQLYLSRQFDIKYQGGLFDELPEESLILELQRSLDYFERQMGQGPPAAILFCGDNITPDKITQTIKNSLPGQASCLNLAEKIIGIDQCEEYTVQLCLGAIGGALRKQVAA
ncbi:MSHA biogenesis protein MshI1 [Aurantivibrio infirmus]